MAPRKTSRTRNIPEAAIKRLSLYDRCLEECLKAGKNVVSSSEIARRCGTNPAQIRKDFAYFGAFGVRGVGYYLEDLKSGIRKALGINHPWSCALVGAGPLGQAILGTASLARRGFDIKAVFVEEDPATPGKGSIQGIPMFGFSQIKKVVAELGIRIAIIAVGQVSTVKIVHQLTDAGVKGILTFTQPPPDVPARVILRNVDFAMDLEEIAFRLNKA